MKRIRTTTILSAALISGLLCACPSPTQAPGEEGNGSPATIIVGYVKDEYGTSVAGQWMDGEWSAYEAGTSAFIVDTLVYDNDIYSIGNIDSIGGIESPCIWKNGSISVPEGPSDAINRGALGASIIDGRVAVAGYAKYDSTTVYGDVPGYWLEGAWTALARPLDKNWVYAYGIIKNDDAVLICGYDGTSALLWTDGVLSTLTAPTNASKASARSLISFEGNIYCGGYATISGVVSPCIWENGVPTLLEQPVGSDDARVFGLEIKDDEVVATGRCYAGDGSTMKAGYWRSGAWIELPNAPGKTSGVVSSASRDDSGLFAGYSTDESEADVPGYWDAGVWQALSLPSGAVSGIAKAAFSFDSVVGTAPGSASGLIVYTAGLFDNSRPILDANGKLLYEIYSDPYTKEPNEDFLATNATAVCYDGADVYFCGSMERVDETIDRPAYWRNGVRVDLDMPASATSGVATDIALGGSSVYVAGYYRDSSIQTPCLWINGERTDLPIGSSLGGEAHRIAVVGSDTYISGYYIETEGTPDDTLKVCFWKNGVRNDIESVKGLPSLMVFGIATSGADVYLCGASESDSGAIIPSYWEIDGASLSRTDLDAGSATKAGIIGLTLDGSDVYATGGAYAETTGWKPVVWRNGTLSELEILEAVQSDNTLQTGISIAIDGSDVYVAGMRYSPDANNSGEVPALWKNGELVQLSEMGTYGTLMDISIRRY